MKPRDLGRWRSSPPGSSPTNESEANVSPHGFYTPAGVAQQRYNWMKRAEQRQSGIRSTPSLPSRCAVWARATSRPVGTLPALSWIYLRQLTPAQLPSNVLLSHNYFRPEWAAMGQRRLKNLTVLMEWVPRPASQSSAPPAEGPAMTRQPSEGRSVPWKLHCFTVVAVAERYCC